jgi:hypothetical protein
VVEVDGGELCGVALNEAQRAMVLSLIVDISGDAVKLVKLPGVKMVPLSELGEAL